MQVCAGWPVYGSIRQMLCSVARGGQFGREIFCRALRGQETLRWADKKAMSRKGLRRLMAWGTGGSDRQGQACGARTRRGERDENLTLISTMTLASF